MKSANGWIVKMQVFDDQSLSKVSKEPGAFATLRFPHQDHCRDLRVELGGAKRCSTGHCRVAVDANPEMDGTYHRGILQVLDLSIVSQE